MYAHLLCLHLEELRERVTIESSARTAAQNALAEEQRSRRCAEAALEDVRRECRAPFVVPAVVDALLRISNFSDKVVGEM